VRSAQCPAARDDILGVQPLLTAAQQRWGIGCWQADSGQSAHVLAPERQITQSAAPEAYRISST
jgi:hypothetical protein